METMKKNDIWLVVDLALVGGIIMVIDNGH